MLHSQKPFPESELLNQHFQQSYYSKFTKASILGKPPLQPSRNHLVVRQPNAFTSERPRISRPRFASQVDEKNDLSKTVTPHYLPKVRESAAAKPHQVNAPNYSRNSHKESYGSNDMVHAYFLEDARKMTQDKTRIPNHRDMASTRAHCTPNACTPKLRNIYRSSPVSKCSGGMSNGEPLVDHSRNSSSFSDSKKFICSICHKYIFNTNHDDCITKIPNTVNSRAKVQSPKIKNNNPVEPKNHTHKPGRQNGIGQRFSLNKSSAVHEKPHTPRSYLRWKPTGRIFKTVSLRWIPTGKVFIDSTTKVDSEPPNGSNDDITNPYECNQTLYVSAGTSNSSAGLVLHLDVVWTKQFKPRSSSKDVWTKQFRPLPTVVDKYLGTKLDDALLKILERHTADLIEKYSVLPGPESIKNQESEKSPKEIIIIKREQGKEKQDFNYSIRPQGKLIVDDDKVDDDDEGPSAGSTGRSGKEKKDPIMPLLALTSPGWAVTDTRDDVNSAMPSI
ncbi:hypothetical protein Tco_0536939 [Tanacetum coccineum]